MNSETTETTGFFTITTYYGDTFTDPTDVSTSLTVKMDPATIGVASISSSQPRVAQ